MPCVCKITCLNGNIHDGLDLADSIDYFGSASTALITAVFTAEQRSNMTIRNETLTAARAEISAKEVESIRALRANDLVIGCN